MPLSLEQILQTTASISTPVTIATWVETAPGSGLYELVLAPVEEFSGSPAPNTLNPTANYVWDTGLFRWVMETQPTGGGGGGGGPATIADGADVAEGSTTDAAVIMDTSGTVSGKLRGLVKWAFERMPASLGQKPMATSFPVVIASDQSALAVTGTFFQATQPVSGTVAVSNFPATQAVSGTVSAIQSGAWTVGVSGSVAVTGPLTDAQLRASPVPVSGTVSTTGLTDAELRASPVPVSAAQSGTWNIGILTTITNVVHVDDNGGSLTIDGSISFTVPQHVIVDSGAITVSGSTGRTWDLNFAVDQVDVTGSLVGAVQSGTWSVGRTWTLASGTDSVAATQSGTWNIGTLTTVTNVVHVDDNAGSLTVDGTVAVSNFPATQPVSGTVAVTAVAANSEPQYVEGAVSLLSQNITGQVRVTEDIQMAHLDVLSAILVELRVHSIVLHQTLNSRDDLRDLRNAEPWPVTIQ